MIKVYIFIGLQQKQTVMSVPMEPGCEGSVNSCNSCQNNKCLAHAGESEKANGITKVRRIPSLGICTHVHCDSSFHHFQANLGRLCRHATSKGKISQIK